MPKREEYKGLSKTARELLAGAESTEDFKRETRAVHAEDLVAFANSDAGSTILIGVDERPAPVVSNGGRWLVAPWGRVELKRSMRVAGVLIKNCG